MHTLKIFFFSCCFMVFSKAALAQKEGWNWYFGMNAGITFSGGTPTALMNGALSTWEGVASISDANGNLLFYTEGTKVYNALHNVMPNGSGLFGDQSSTQSAVIVQKPGSQALYYIFTVDANENLPGKGFNYTVVDMGLNGGLGDVVQKNVFIRNTITEKVTIARHANNRDFWVLIKDWQDDDIFAYKLSCNGLNMTPVKSLIAPFNISNLAGYMKVSRQNNKIAMAMPAEKSFVVLDFNNSTGIASNKKFITGDASMYGAYGVEFSPDGNFLYGAIVEPTPKLFQFDLNAGSGAAIYNSRVMIATHPPISVFFNYYYGALQLGPDGKIYSVNHGDTVLGVINNPNIAGAGCNYQNGAVNLNGRKGVIGLPNFLTDYLFPLPKDTIFANICSGSGYALPDGSIVTSSGIYTTHLQSSDFCDSLVITNLTVNSTKRDTINKNICLGQTYLGYSSTGQYIDTFATVLHCDSIRVLNLTVSQRIFTNINYSICQGDNYYGHVSTGVYVDTFISSFGCDSVRTVNLLVKPVKDSIINKTICEPGSFLGYSTSGTYRDTFISSTGCDSTRTINLTVVKNVKPDLGADRTICKEESLVLFPGVFSSYLWQDGSTNDRYVVNSSGRYSVVVTNVCATQSDDIVITKTDCNLYFPNAFTPNKDSRNDLFKIANSPSFKEYKLSVYNRWGIKVFETNDINEGWDGTYKGKDQDAGAFIWLCKYKNALGYIDNLQGTVMLIR